MLAVLAPRRHGRRRGTTRGMARSRGQGGERHVWLGRRVQLLRETSPAAQRCWCEFDAAGETNRAAPLVPAEAHRRVLSEGRHRPASFLSARSGQAHGRSDSISSRQRSRQDTWSSVRCTTSRRSILGLTLVSPQPDSLVAPARLRPATEERQRGPYRRERVRLLLSQEQMATLDGLDMGSAGACSWNPVNTA